MARDTWEAARATRQAVAADAVLAQDALRAATSRRDQLQRDVAHAAAAQRDAASNAARLAQKVDRLKADAATLPTQVEAARAEAERTSAAVGTAEAQATEAAERAAGVRTRKGALTALLDQATSRARRAGDTLARLRAEHARATAQIVDPARVEAAQRAQAEAEDALGELRTRLEGAQQASAVAAADATSARAEANRCEGIRSKLAAEAGALAEILEVRGTERWPQMLDQLHVPPGMEAALGAALGEEIEAGDDPAAPRHWRVLQQREAEMTVSLAWLALVAAGSQRPAQAHSGPSVCC